MHNRTIDQILSLIDNVLGPDDNGPVPEYHELYSYGDAHSPNGPVARRNDQYRREASQRQQLPSNAVVGRRRAEPGWWANQPRQTKGPISVHRLHTLRVDDLERRLGEKSECPLANNTKLVRNSDGTFGVVLHRTQIITFDLLDNVVKVTLNSGGYATTTTKQRLNQLLPSGCRVYARKFEWFVSTPEGEVPFFDGMTITLINWH